MFQCLESLAEVEVKGLNLESVFWNFKKFQMVDKCKSDF